MLQQGGTDSHGRSGLFIAADLDERRGLDRSCRADARSKLHVASPFPAGVPKHEDELIVPARDGALRVLRAARAAGVKRVVLTSSFAAVGYGHPPQTAPFNESNWTELGEDVAPYVKSKTLAERSAWAFIAAEGGGLELAVVNPVAVFGPDASGADYSTSILLAIRN